jgi:TldD protein
MKELTNVAIDKLSSAGAAFGDVRIVTEKRNSVAVRQRSVKSIRDSESRGYGVRALVDGAWGFASSTNLTPDGVARTTDAALRVAKASRTLPQERPAVMAPEDAYKDTFVTPVAKDPFEVSNAEKAELLPSTNPCWRSRRSPWCIPCSVSYVSSG